MISFHLCKGSCAGSLCASRRRSPWSWLLHSWIQLGECVTTLVAKRCVNIANVLFVTPCNFNKKLLKTFQLFFYVEDKGLLSGHDLATPEPSVDRWQLLEGSSKHLAMPKVPRSRTGSDLHRGPTSCQAGCMPSRLHQVEALNHQLRASKVWSSRRVNHGDGDATRRLKELGHYHTIAPWACICMHLYKNLVDS